MNYEMYSVYDGAVQAYGRPFLARTKEEAMRAVATDAQQPESPLFKFPHQYALFRLAEFDDTTGQLKQDKTYVGHIHEIVGTLNEQSISNGAQLFAGTASGDTAE